MNKINGLWVVIGFVVAGCGGNSSSEGSQDVTAAYHASILRLRQVDTGLLMYTGDYDNLMPLAESWMDSVGPYVRDAAAFRSPRVEAANPDRYGFALNAALAGRPVSHENPGDVVSVFDSTNTARNASEPTSTMPDPPRYGKYNTVAYLDGHVKNEFDVVEPYAESLQRVKQCLAANLIYANDCDDAFPLPEQWMDGMTPYVKSIRVFQSPAVEKQGVEGRYGYAMNKEVAGHRQLDFADPLTTLAIFDSTRLRRNATAPVSTLPNPPRYGPNNTLGFLDGHARGSAEDPPGTLAP